MQPSRHPQKAHRASRRTHLATSPADVALPLLLVFLAASLDVLPIHTSQEGGIHGGTQRHGAANVVEGASQWCELDVLQQAGW